MNAPLVSICVANYNGMAVIDDCIQSVLSQTGNLPVEIIIHDDASQDDSVQHIRNHHPQAKLIESSENVGFCIANNRMTAAAQGKYLLLLNNDATLFPDALATLYKVAQETGGPAILGLPQYDYDTGELLDIGSLLDPFLNPVPNQNPLQSDVGMVMGACLWIPKSLWDDLGSFPEWFDSIGEDLYLCCRARLAGYPVRALGVSGYRHHVGRSFGGGKAQRGRLTTTFRRRALSERNKTFVMAMTYPTPLMQLTLPIHLLLLLVEGSLLSVLSGRLAYLKEIYLPVAVALVQKRHLWQSCRRDIMRKRQITTYGFFSVFDPLPYKLRMLVRYGIPAVK
ncbi:MAG: glycosyltransferase [Gallionellaceae bacterium]|nr:glycosyltransferase [Gallionellaceae bacterium]